MLKPHEEALLGTQSGVIDINVSVLAERRLITEVVVVVDAVLIGSIGDQQAVVDRGLGRATGDVAVEHAVHHHCAQVIDRRCVGIVSDNATHICAAGDGGEIITVHHP